MFHLIEDSDFLVFVFEFSEMSNKGFDAYDSTVGQEVLVMTSVLCFLADSPMHAEITNTHIPGVSLNPCRVCNLSSPTIKARKKMEYVSKFLHKDLHGSHVCPPIWNNFQMRC